MADFRSNLKISYVSPDELRPFDGNPRSISDVGLKKLQRSIEEFGFTNPILVQRETNMVIAGHQRLKAAKMAGLARVPVVYLDMDDTTAKAYNVADNRTAQEAEWDNEKLGALFGDLKSAEFDLSLTGFDADELDELFDELEGYDDGFDEAAELEAISEPRCTVGEVWQLGQHRIVCGDSTKAETWDALLEGKACDLVVTSPPYNVGIDYRQYQDRKEREEYLGFIAAVGEQAFRFIRPGRFVAWNIGVAPNTFPHHQVVTLEKCGFQFYRQIVWEKAGVPYPIFGSSLRAKAIRHYKPNYKHEMIYLLEAPGDAELPRVECPICEGSGSVHGHVAPISHDMLVLATRGEIELGGESKPSKRYAHDVWRISQSQATVDLPTLGTKSTGLNKKGRASHMIKAHPAAFPVELPAAVMTFLAGPGERVVDPFVGAGATIIAAEKLGRVALGIELDPVYCELTLRRWEKLTGNKAVRHNGRIPG